MHIKNGVWPVMITPFTKDNAVDYDGVLELISWYDRMGVTGLFAICQSSEMFELTARERIDLLRFIMRNTPGHMGVIASGHVDDDPEAQIREAQASVDEGILSYVFVSNRFAREDEGDDAAKRAIERLILTIRADSFGIYECPYPYKRLMSPSLLKWCAETGKFSFLKDTCCDLKQLRDKCDAVRGTGLKIFNANSATLLESLKMGCAGYSGVMANFHADLYCWLVDNYDKQPARARVMMDFLGAASLAEYQTYPVNSKYHMALEGLSIGTLSRRQDDRLLTGNRRLEIEQLRGLTRTFREYFNSQPV